MTWGVSVRMRAYLVAEERLPERGDELRGDGVQHQVKAQHFAA